MAKPPSREQIALQEALLKGDPKELSDFLLVNSGTMRRFLKLNTTQFDELQDVLTKGSAAAVDRALDYVDGFLENPKRLRANAVHLTPLVRKAVVSAQHQTESEKSRASRAEKAPISSFANAWASIMSSWGFDRKERNAIAIGFWTPMIAGVAMNAFGTASTAHASIPVDVEPASHADTLKERFNAPLEFTVTPKKSDPFALIMQSDYKMMPSLIRHIGRDPQAKEYVEWCLEAAAQHKIDGNLFANQMYKESFWFKPEVINGTIKSPTGAMGIAQFMPGTAKALGVDPLNPKEAIFAAAKHMKDLTHKYGDQHLAMVVYNGRAEALDFAQTEMGLTKTPTINQWMSFMNERYERLGDEAKHAWHVETRGYIQQISSKFWDTGVQRVALNLPKIVPLPMARPQ